MGPSGAIRKGDYKLIEVFETGKHELYNVRKDIGENDDLASKMPELVTEMASDLKQWRKSSNAKMALINKDYDPKADFRKSRNRKDQGSQGYLPKSVSSFPEMPFYLGSSSER